MAVTAAAAANNHTHTWAVLSLLLPYHSALGPVPHPQIPLLDGHAPGWQPPSMTIVILHTLLPAQGSLAPTVPCTRWKHSPLLCKHHCPSVARCLPLWAWSTVLCHPGLPLEHILPWSGALCLHVMVERGSLRVMVAALRAAGSSAGPSVLSICGRNAGERGDITPHASTQQDARRRTASQQ